MKITLAQPTATGPGGAAQRSAAHRRLLRRGTIRRMPHVVRDMAAYATYGCWAAVGIVWLVGALRRGPSAVERRDHGADLVSVGVACLALLIARSSPSLWRPVVVDASWVRLAGVVLLLPATATTIWARIALGSMWSAAAVTRPGHVLRTNGPYAITRHPIYSGILAMVLATTLAQGLGRWLAVLVVVALGVLVRVRAEERLLRVQFPAQHRQYRARVPRLVPRVALTRRCGRARAKT